MRRLLLLPLICIAVLGSAMLFSSQSAIHWPSLLSRFELFAEPKAPLFIPRKTHHVQRAHGMEIYLLAAAGKGAALPRDIEAAFDEPCALGVAVRHGDVWYTDFATLAVDNVSIPATQRRPLRELPGLQRVLWCKVEPTRPAYANSDDTPGWWDAIEYREFVWVEDAPGLLMADVAPVGLSGVLWRDEPVGTMRFKVALEFDDHWLATPGREAVTRHGDLPGVRRVARMANTGIAAVDHAYAMANLPYIWGSASPQGGGSPQGHQSEHFIGADCADMIAAAWRRAGVASLRYTSVRDMTADYARSPRAFVPAGLWEHEAVASSSPSRPASKKVYVDAEGRPLPIRSKHDADISEGVRLGAAVLWVYGDGAKGHAALLVEDTAPLGVLDPTDLALHTSWGPPRVQPLGAILRGLTPRLVLNPPAEASRDADTTVHAQADHITDEPS